MAGLALAGLFTAGCADLARVTSLAPDPIDANSPVAAQARLAQKAHYRRPRFSDVPAKPTDVRAPAQFRAAVAENIQARRTQNGWIAGHPAFVSDDTESFAAAERARIPASATQPIASDPAGTEDYAARLRALATPPPPPK